jgi:hypothetical protein
MFSLPIFQLKALSQQRSNTTKHNAQQGANAIQRIFHYYKNTEK